MPSGRLFVRILLRRWPQPCTCTHPNILRVIAILAKEMLATPSPASVSRVNNILAIFAIMSAICSTPPKEFFVANGAAIPTLSAVAQSPNKTTFDAALFKQVDEFMRSDEYQRKEQVHSH